MLDWLIEVAQAVFDRVTLPLPLGLLVGWRDVDGEGDNCDCDEGDSDEYEPAMCTIDWGDCRNENDRRWR